MPGFGSALLVPLLQFISGVIELLLGLRIILKLLGANTTSTFVSWVYINSEPLIDPFKGMFLQPTFTGGFTIEFSTIFALLVYSFLGYMALGLINMMESFTSRANKSSEKNS